jgi:hypothetical protein
MYDICSLKSHEFDYSGFTFLCSRFVYAIKVLPFSSDALATSCFICTDDRLVCSSSEFHAIDHGWYLYMYIGTLVLWFHYIKPMI